MNKKAIIFIFLTIIWMGVIFCFSGADGNTSNNTSTGIINNVITLYESVTGKSLNHEEIINHLNYPIRKIAHFSVYFILGILCLNIFINLNYKYKVIISILICFLYSVFDEFHQTFVSGRSGMFTDCLIDTSGAITSIMIIYLYFKKIRKTNI